MIRSTALAALAFVALTPAPASAQLMGARELTTTAPVKGVGASKPAPDIYYLAGESGAKETFTLTIKGPARLTLFTPDGHEMVSATGSGKVNLTAYLNLTDVFTLAVLRTDPAQAYTLARQSRLPTLMEAKEFSNIGYTFKGSSSGDLMQCWITPGVKYRTARGPTVVELTLAADRETITGVGRDGDRSWSFDKTVSLAGNTMTIRTRFPDGTIKENNGELRRPSLDDGAAREFSGYMCPDVASRDEPLTAAADPAREAAASRAKERAKEDAEFAAKQKAYEEELAAHQAAVEQYQKALADVAAQQAAGAAKAKADQDEFARKQAEYEAEVARARQAQEEYDAKYGKPQ